jgi:protein-S-isoprenylcysteine O-methyltransferase Ste14
MAGRTGSGNNMHMSTPNTFSARGGWWAVVQVPLLVAAVFLPDWDGVPDKSFGVPMRMLGWGIVAIAMSLFAGSIIPLLRRRALTPIPQPAQNASLVTEGLYRWMRHPLYSSMIVGTFGWALVQLSLATVLYAIVMAVFFDRKVAREEMFLRERYPQYDDYARRVRRFLPGIY